MGMMFSSKTPRDLNRDLCWANYPAGTRDHARRVLTRLAWA
jgi:hypothetical protein